MKTIRHILMLTLVASAVCFTSCKDDKEDDQTSTNQTSEAGFFYAENGASTKTKADAAQVNKQHNTIIARKNNTTVVEIVLTDLKAGTYDLSAKYAFTYVKDGKFWEATAGQLIITKNDGKVISGTFDATAGAGVDGVNKVSGTFSDISIQ
jgi:hypothetical protein